MSKPAPHIPSLVGAQREPTIGAVFLRAAAFFLASSIAVCFPMLFGRWLWPEGLSGGVENVFWPASGVNLAGLLILGWRYAPVILLDAFSAWPVIGQPLELCLIGATGNMLEALLGWVILRQVGRFAGSFANLRTILALLLASVTAPLVCSLSMPLYLTASGRFTGSEFWAAVGNWNLANGASILLLTPFFIAVWRQEWTLPRRWTELVAWAGGGILCTALAFSAVFRGAGLNFAFLVFPFVILVAVRFGLAETAAALVFVMAGLYFSAIFHAHELPLDKAPEILWFLQAFSWVVAATGLVVAALMNERRAADQRALRNQTRALEASLREERARLSALRYQINPHFLFNALNSIRATLPLTQEISREMVTSLASYLRSTLANPEVDFLPLQEEFAAVEHYLAIEKQRFGDDLRVDIALDPTLASRAIPVALLQPLVENAIRHGFESSRDPMDLRLRAHQSGETLILEIANTGTWKPPGSHSGLGLENIRRRLALIYGEAGRLTHSAENGWVRVTLSLPSSLSDLKGN